MANRNVWVVVNDYSNSVFPEWDTENSYVGVFPSKEDALRAAEAAAKKECGSTNGYLVEEKNDEEKGPVTQYSCVSGTTKDIYTIIPVVV